MAIPTAGLPPAPALATRPVAPVQALAQVPAQARASVQVKVQAKVQAKVRVRAAD
jgi:hypothetical protein